MRIKTIALVLSLVLAMPSSAGWAAGNSRSIAEAQGEDSGLSLSEILAKSLTAYGGESSVAQIASGFSVFGREYHLPGLENLTENLGGATADSSFRLLRKGPKWRLDHEGSAGPNLTEGFTGDNAWAQSGGHVHDLQLANARLLNFETTLPAAFVLEGVKALRENGGTALELSLKGKTTYRQIPVWAIEFKAGDDSFVLYLDQNNYMVTAITAIGIAASGANSSSGDDSTAAAVKNIALEYSEYRPAGGTVYPHRLARRVDGKIDLLRVCTEMSAQAAAVKDHDFDRPGGTSRLSRSISVPFDYGQREILVKGRLNNGDELDFLVDTGASDTIIDRRVAAESFLLKEGVADLRALGGLVQTNTTTIGRLELGNLIVNDIDARILDLSSQSRHLGRRLGGIIGTNIISRYVVAIEYAKGTVTFFDADTFSPAADLVAVPFSRRSAPVVKVRLNGKEEVQMLVDTGAAFNNLPSAVAARYSQDANHHATEGTGLDGRPVKLGRVSVDTVSIGGKPVRRVDFTYTLGQTGGSQSGKQAADSGFFQSTNLGILGNPFLENFQLLIDYKYQRLLIRQSTALKKKSDIEQALASGDEELVQKRDFRQTEAFYNKALLLATTGGDKRNEARALGRFGNLRRIMAKDLGRPEHSKTSYDYYVRAQAMAKKLGATEIEGRILADWSLLYLDDNQMVAAKQTMDRALQLAPQDPAVNVDCAVHLFKARRFPEMQRYVDQALFLDPSNWQALWYQVKLSETFGDYARVVSTLKEIQRFYPNSKVAQEKLKILQPGTAPNSNSVPAGTGNMAPSLTQTGTPVVTPGANSNAGVNFSPSPNTNTNTNQGSQPSGQPAPGSGFPFSQRR